MRHDTNPAPGEWLGDSCHCDTRGGNYLPAYWDMRPLHYIYNPAKECGTTPDFIVQWAQIGSDSVPQIVMLIGLL